MQFYNVFLAAAAFALTSAQTSTGGVEFTMDAAFFAKTYNAGTSQMNLTWDMNSGPVNLLLKNGLASNLQTVATIASAVKGTSYLYIPDQTLASGSYAFEVVDTSSGLDNFSQMWSLTGGTGTSSSNSTTTTTSGSSSSSTTTATTSASTTTKSSSTTTKTTSSSTGTSTSTTPNTNSASNIASPFALIFLAFAAMVLN